MRRTIWHFNTPADVAVHNCFYLPENEQEFNFNQYDYIVDAVDTVTAKISIICKAKKLQIPVISSMGAGNKMDAAAFRAGDISNTSVCPLARVMRRELKKRGIDSLKVVYSKEKPMKPMEEFMEESSDTGMLSNRRSTPGSVSFVPPVAGLLLAGEVVKDIIGYPSV